MAVHLQGDSGCPPKSEEKGIKRQHAVPVIDLISWKHAGRDKHLRKNTNADGDGLQLAVLVDDV